MDGEDIYGDLDDFDLGDTMSKFEENNKALTKSVEESQRRIDILASEVSTLNKVNKDLKTNISELFKTAKAEIERKTRQLADLRRDMDDAIFRRGNKNNTTEADKESLDKDELLKQLQQARNALAEKNRIISSLNKELQNAKVQNMERNESKRNASHIDDEHDDKMYKRQKNNHYDNEQTNYRKSNYHHQSRDYDDRRNRSGSKSPDRRQSFHRNSDYRANNNKRFNKFNNRSRSNDRGRYDSRDPSKDKHYNDRFKYKQQGYDNSRPEHTDKHLGKGQNDRFTYSNYNGSEFRNRSESSYNSRSSVDDRRHTSPGVCEKSDEQKHNDNMCDNSLQTARITHQKNYKPTEVKMSNEELEEGELDSTIADSNEDSINPYNIPVNVDNGQEILKEDIRNIVTVEDILQEPESNIKVVGSETCQTDKVVISDNTDNALTHAEVTANTQPATRNEPVQTNTTVQPETKPSTEPVTTARPAQNVTKPIIKRKRRRCVISIT